MLAECSFHCTCSKYSAFASAISVYPTFLPSNFSDGAILRINDPILGPDIWRDGAILRINDPILGPGPWALGPGPNLGPCGPGAKWGPWVRAMGPHGPMWQERP